jgi:hypothetical protein
MSETGLTVPDMNEPLSRYTVTVTVGCDGGYLPDPAAFAAAADQATWSRSASIVSAHLADKIISVVTVTAPDRYAAMTVAQAVVSDALKRQAPSSQPADDLARHRTEVPTGHCAPEQLAAGVRGPRVRNAQPWLGVTKFLHTGPEPSCRRFTLLFEVDQGGRISLAPRAVRIDQRLLFRKEKLLHA